MFYYVEQHVKMLNKIAIDTFSKVSIRKITMQSSLPKVESSLPKVEWQTLENEQI